MKLHGKTLLVTGAARRIGRAIALMAARRGARVVLHYSRSRSEAEALGRALRAEGAEAHLVRADLAPVRGGFESALRVLVRDVLDAVGHVDVLVNNASAFYPTPLDSLSEKDWDTLLGVNLKAPCLLAREFGLRMKKRGAGKIVNITDAARPAAGYLPYAVSKAGLEAATVSLARELAPAVQVNAVAPGPILPPAGMSAAGMRRVAARTLLGRFGDPEDIAETVRFLIEGTDFITGAVVPVDGGMRHV